MSEQLEMYSDDRHTERGGRMRMWWTQEQGRSVYWCFFPVAHFVLGCKHGRQRFLRGWWICAEVCNNPFINPQIMLWSLKFHSSCLVLSGRHRACGVPVDIRSRCSGSGHCLLSGEHLLLHLQVINSWCGCTVEHCSLQPPPDNGAHVEIFRVSSVTHQLSI